MATCASVETRLIKPKYDMKKGTASFDLPACGDSPAHHITIHKDTTVLGGAAVSVDGEKFTLSFDTPENFRKSLGCVLDSKLGTVEAGKRSQMMSLSANIYNNLEIHPPLNTAKGSEGAPLLDQCSFGRKRP